MAPPIGFNGFVLFILIPLAFDGVPQLILLDGDSRFVLLFGLIPEKISSIKDNVFDLISALLFQNHISSFEECISSFGRGLDWG